MNRWSLYILALCFGGLAACGEEADEPTPEPSPGQNTQISKEEAAALGGKGDHGDLCAWFGWYDDGVCDTFCAFPDPDCSPTTCEADADCGWGEICESFATCAAVNCPAPPPNRCVAVSCDDGSDQHFACDIIPLCEPGQVAAVLDGCFECVDARTCQPPQTEVACGARLGDTCASDEFCDFSEQAMCGYADATGVCAPRPEACTQIYQPVCACDGQTYGNDCEARAARVDVYHDGACEQPQQGPECSREADCAADEVCNEGVCIIDAGGAPGTCGGFTGQACADDEYCDFEPQHGSACGFADGTGTCKPRPEACAQVFMPVCGCDGNTYGNACMAAAAGIDVQADGACE